MSLRRVRTLWRSVTRPSQHDADMNEEMRFHVEMETERLMARGLDEASARRQAALAFGGIHRYRGAVLDALRLTWLRGLSIDLKLGVRMLVKYPGLTVVALFALSLAIGAGAAYLEFINDLMHGTLPFNEADRIVGIVNWDQQTGDPELRSTAHFLDYRQSLKSIQDLAAYRSLERNLITSDGRAEAVRGVQISAAAFRIARVPPFLGRPLVPEDESAGAAPVVVIGYDLWRTRFGSDVAIVGRVIHLDKTAYTVVGVMPEGFGLPVSHSLWVPLVLNDAVYARREGPSTRMFGRLAAGASIGDAQTELDVIATRQAAEFPQTDRYLRPFVKPYVESLWSAAEDSRMQTIVFYSANVLFVGLLALCGANVATLVFARTASRETEIGVRTALGASRARIAGQLFAEALVLSSIAAVLGLAFGAVALRWVKHTIIAAEGEPLWFWWNDNLAPATMAYAAMLAVAAAAIIGIVPALKATSPRIQERLKQAFGVSAAGFKFGGVWTGVIVSQVAITVVFFTIVSLLGWSAYVTRGGERARMFPAGEYVSALLRADRPARATYAELAERLATEPAVAGVTYAARLPGMGHRTMTIEIDGMSAGSASAATSFVRTTGVAMNFFDVFQAPIVAGRRFEETDLQPGHEVAIVDRTFVRRLLKGQNAIGRRVRDAGENGAKPDPWIEIVGVVADLTDETNKLPKESVLYRPASIE